MSIEEMNKIFRTIKGTGWQSIFTWHQTQECIAFDEFGKVCDTWRVPTLTDDDSGITRAQEIIIAAYEVLREQLC